MLDTIIHSYKLSFEANIINGAISILTSDNYEGNSQEILIAFSLFDSFFIGIDSNT